MEISPSRNRLSTAVSFKNPDTKLSAWTRAKKEFGRAAPLIAQDTFDAIVSSFPSYGVADKQRLLIQILAEQTSYPGESVYLNYTSLWPQVWASGSEETRLLGRWPYMIAGS